MLSNVICFLLPNTFPFQLLTFPIAFLEFKMSQILMDLEKAMKLDDVSLIEKCLERYTEDDFQQLKKISLSLTNLACSQRRIEVVRFLAKKSRSVAWIKTEFEEISLNGNTALHYALKLVYLENISI